MERQNQTVAGEGLQPSGKPGFYQELSPQEFSRRKELVVLLLKAPDAGEAFTGFREVISSADSGALLRAAAKLGRGQPIGIVCIHGDCSGRLAIRLSNQGYSVYHLGGGLWEWYHCFRGHRGGTA